ncbi:MAG: hypothetical protein ACI8YQ_002174 [Polaribacter sp.]|jgi:hypothetical protein
MRGGNFEEKLLTKSSIKIKSPVHGIHGRRF